MNIEFVLDGRIYRGLLKTMPICNDILACLPTRLAFMRGEDREYYARLDIRADAADCCKVSEVERNGLYWFSEWNALCIVLRDTDISPFSVIHIGDMDDDISSTLQFKGNRTEIEVRK